MTLGDEHYRIHEGKVFFLHDKRDGVAATVTAEAMVQAFLRRDREGRCPFRMERTQPHQRRAFPFKADVRCEHVLYADAPDFGYGGFTDHRAVTFFQQSMMACPEYLGRDRFSGFIGLI